MDDLIGFVVGQGGVVALLIIIVIVLWLQLSQNNVTVPKKIYEQLISYDERRQEQLLLLIEKLYESQRNTQETLADIRRTQDISLYQERVRSLPSSTISDDEKLIKLLKRLDNKKIEELIRLIEERE